MINEANKLPNDIATAHFVINELTLNNHKLSEENHKLSEENQKLQQQVDWFKRQIFGEKSEKIVKDDSNSKQLWLGATIPEKAAAVTDSSVTIKGHQRQKRGKQALEDDCGESGLRFDSTVPVEEVPCPPAEIKELSSDEYEVVDTKYTERLCQRAGSYYIKRYVRPVVKLKGSGNITNAPAPAAVFDRSYADVSLLAGMAVDKFQYFLPLYRQHQRLSQAGVKIARANLSSWLHRAASLLEPVYNAVLLSVLKSLVLAMDETPLKAGQEKKGQLHRGYVWVMYGDKDEAAFLYSPTRALSAVEPHIKTFCGTLITDGYSVYDKMCKRYEQIVHALCWAHTRREFYEARDYEPQRCDKALDYIKQLYEEEAKIKELGLSGEQKLTRRVEKQRKVVDQLFEWLKLESSKAALLPSNPFLKAANYALEREQGLRVYLTNPDVPIDTNHLEREVRPLPLGRKNWLFCWTEVGADVVAIFQTLISCCKLQGISPFDYLVDVLTKLDSHPFARVHELTPREWAAANSLAKS